MWRTGIVRYTTRTRSCDSSRWKLSCCKDDRTMPMRRIYGCPENFRQSLSTPTATFAEIFNRILYRSILWMCIQNLKFVALPIPEIIVGTQKIWAVPGYAHAPFSPKFLTGFCSDGSTLWMYRLNLQSVAFVHATFSYPTSSLPKISPCSPGSRWMAFGLRRAKMLS